MTRLQSELHRLYLPAATPDAVPVGEHASLIDADGRVRAMVLALAGPADWAVLSPVWQAVQSELGLPAPAIAVSGADSYQLWFSLALAVPAAQAQAFVEGLRQRYLSHIAPARISLLPADEADAPQLAWQVTTMPVQQVHPDQWSAFVAPDLAPIFAETPWLDIPPNPEGQADLLSRVQSIKPADWQTALAQLRPAPLMARPASVSTGANASESHPSPRRFLLDVMNDATVALPLRIEAAKALLPYTQPSPAQDEP
jgi:hypothetical protein